MQRRTDSRPARPADGAPALVHTEEVGTRLTVVLRKFGRLTRGDTLRPVPEQLEVRVPYLPRMAWLLIINAGVLTAILILTDGPVWLVLLFLALLVVTFAVQAGFSWSRNRSGPVMTLDRDGVTVKGYPRVAWSSIDRLSIGRVLDRRGRRLLGGSSLGDVVAFMPRPNVEMPPPPGGLNVSAETDAEWRDERLSVYGTNLTVVTGYLSVTSRQLADFAAQVGGVPVEYR